MKFRTVERFFDERQNHYQYCAEAMLKNDLISCQEHQVYMALAQCLSDKFTPCPEVLCCMTSLGYKDVEEAIHGLVDAHMLEVDEHDGRRVYKIRA